MELAEAYAKMDILEEQSYLMTATGTNLDKRVYDYGIQRRSATYAKRIAEFKKYKTDADGNFVLDDGGNKILVAMAVPEGLRFAVPNDTTTFVYAGSQDGYEIVECEQSGTVGNLHVGQILPLTPISGLVEARITSTYEPAEDTETDDALRSRAKEKLNYQAFGGNVYDYIEKVNSINGVGQTKVFPAWQFNGSVLLSVVDSQYDPITDEFRERIKEEVDPYERTGEGVGIAPIGHYVTVTTPQRLEIDIRLDVDATKSLDAITEEIEEKLDDYITSIRQQWKQDKTLTVLRALIIQTVLEVPTVINVKDVLINGEASDLVITDEAAINKQYLPYLGEVSIE